MNIETPEQMSPDQFKNWCKHHDANIVKRWNNEKFGITCKKCNSNNCLFINTIDIDHWDYDGETGSGYTVDGALLVKCQNCGHAMTILSGTDSE